MSGMLGPLDHGRVPPAQQTRLGAFLISLHCALARRLALGLPVTFRYGWQTEWHSQLHREVEIATLMMHATSWITDFELPALSLGWEVAWLPHTVKGVADISQAPWVDLAARRAGVVGNDFEAGFALADDLVEHTFGRANAHEAADHEAGAVRDQRHCICYGHCFHRQLRQ